MKIHLMKDTFFNLNHCVSQSVTPKNHLNVMDTTSQHCHVYKQSVLPLNYNVSSGNQCKLFFVILL